MTDTFVPPNLFTHQAALPPMVVDDPHPTGGIEDIFRWKCSCSLDLFYTHTGVVSDDRMAVDDSESHAQDHETHVATLFLKAAKSVFMTNLLMCVAASNVF